MEQAIKPVTIENWNAINELTLMSIGTDKGSWWADPNFGSELYLLRESGKVDGKTAGNFRRMLQECLAWIIEDGLAKSINCAVERSGKNEISYTVEIIKPDDSNIFIKDVWYGIQQG
ncbi:MAG: phage GP46 family protein [Treponema sp.]|jgi:phage gp46-like protein|nr:phage GP46 family protein [Treponema sp.]